LRASLTGKRKPCIDGFLVQASSRGVASGFVSQKRQALAVIPQITLSFACLVFSQVSNAAITIVGNDSLANVDGLKGVSRVSNLSIQSNPALLNLDGLVDLESVSGSLRVLGNTSLDNCSGLARVLGWPDGPPNDFVVGVINISNNGLGSSTGNGGGTDSGGDNTNLGGGCSSADEIVSSVSAPSQPVIVGHSASRRTLSLDFSPSVSTNTAFPVSGYQAYCASSLADLSDAAAADLLDNRPVTRYLTVGNEAADSNSFSAEIEVSVDITHSDPNDLRITLTSPEGTTLLLWDQGNAGGQDIQGTFPTNLTPVEAFDNVVGETLDGTWALTAEDISVGPIVREGILNSWGLRIQEKITVSRAYKAPNFSPAPPQSFQIDGLGRGRGYTCTLAPVTKLGTFPVSDSYMAFVPLEVPVNPYVASTDYEDGKIILTFSVSDNGGTDITGYEATCSDGTTTYTATSTSSPITVSGLTNDVAYTCTVTATNSVGTSSASAATVPITPEEASTGLPIWLLYEATR